MGTLHLNRFETMPLVGAVMTPFPHFVGPDDPDETVRELMERYDIHHVPVHDGSEPVGVISERELAAGRPGSRARDIMLPEPLVVGIGTPLAKVAREMASHRGGAALVVRRGKLAGIVSVTDVCRLLAEVVEELFPEDGDDAA